MAPTGTLQYVVKVSKYCNLRCSYCYEYAELGNKKRIGLDLLRRLFERAAAHLSNSKFDKIDFIWHGGEPFMIGLDYYAAAADLQREILGDRARYINSVQTNLTIFTPRHVEFLKSGGFFDGIGVSFDVYGDQRIDTMGRLRTDQVLANIQTLINEKIGFGAIAVLARNTFADARNIYRFYDELGIPLCFLPFYRSSNEAQVDQHALTFDELVTACKAIFEEWATSERSTPVDPIDEYTGYAVRYLGDDPKFFYDKARDERVFIVDVDGSTWGKAEAYDPDYRYGNIFRDDLATLLDSPGRTRAIEDASDRVDEYCKSCRYFGYCPGAFVSNATVQQQAMLREAGCPVAELISYMIAALEASGTVESIRQARKNAPAKMGALSVEL